MNNKKRNYSWNEFNKDSKLLAQKIEDKQLIFKNIYAVPRGGLVLGVRLSHLLGIPMIFKRHCVSKDTIVVDEICDTGKQLNYYKKHFKVCLHCKPHSKIKPNIYIHETNDYIVYAWEKTK